MLACAACNLSKHYKPVVNPYNSKQRLLNCTEENEFIEHIKETSDGQWEALTEEARYHLGSIGLTADCHKAKRYARYQMLERVLSLITTAIQYKGANPEAVHQQMMATIRDLLEVLKNFPPMITENGPLSAMDWLKSKGVDVSLFNGNVK